MTDSRIPERYLVDRRILRLTPEQRSHYFMSTLWAVSNRTDGYFDREDLPLIPTFDPAAVDALVSCGLWRPSGNGWLDTEFEKVQTSKHDLEALDNARRADREKKARQRAHKRGDHSHCTSETCGELSTRNPSFSPIPGDSPGDVSRGQHRIGEERLGEARLGQEATPAVEESDGAAPCCGEFHGPTDPCPRAVFLQGFVDPGYCSGCGRDLVAGVCPKGCQSKGDAA